MPTRNGETIKNYQEAIMDAIKETEIKNKLDKLAEYQAQRDLIEIDKQRLINEVKIPAEVLEAQRLANMERQRIDSELWKHQSETGKNRDAELLAVTKPALPPEYMAAMEEYQNKRNEIASKYVNDDLESTKVAANEKVKIDADLQVKVADVYNQVAIRKEEIEAEFKGTSQAADENIQKLTEEIKADIKSVGESVKGAHYQGVYVKGRITWNTDKMEAWIVDHPFLQEARKEGDPSVSIRRI
jgi:hypothetical protein